MPPAVFVAAAEGAFGAGPARDEHLFAVPAARKPGDTLLAIIAGAADASVDNDNSPHEWEQLGSLTVANGTVLVARRIAAADDPAVLELHTDTSGAWAGAALLVYRGLHPTVPLVGASASNIASSASFICPSRDLTYYSDLYLGIVVVTGGAIAVAPPGGCTERIDFSPDTDIELAIFDFFAETPGATGTKAATTALIGGIAASIAVAADGLLGGKSLSSVSPVPGMLGLPRRGV